MSKICSSCGKNSDETPFPFRAGSDSKLRSRCVKCESIKRTERGLRNPEGYKHRHKKYQQKVKLMRKNNIDVARWIMTDSRKADQKHGHVFDLTKDWVADKISQGCEYCGETSLRMTLDRVDNNRGHTKDNVVPACIRCNYIRRDMPYDAWLKVAPGMRQARLAGAFGDWTGRIK